MGGNVCGSGRQKGFMESLNLCGNPFLNGNISDAAALVACTISMSSNALIILFITLLFGLSQSCDLSLFSPVSNTRILCVGTRGLSQLSRRRHGTGIHHPPINALFPSLSSSRRTRSKVFCQSVAAKAQAQHRRGLLTQWQSKKTRGRSILKEGS